MKTSRTWGTVDPAFWRDRRVLVTGHNGFKGAWLCLWLQALGARVCGASLAAPPTTPSLYELAGVQEGMDACFACDVRDSHALARAVHDARAEVVIHLAAQPLVRASFAEPAETFAVNALGTAHLLDAVRGCEGLRAVVVVTSDKCYAPNGSTRGHVEDDPLGGEDPYSASKACAELIVQAYRDSFFSDPGAARIASARAGNVIGGGDFGAERLLPDVFRAALAGTLEGNPHGGGHPEGHKQASTRLLIRNPDAVRPWQHVLSPLSGYLVLAQALCESRDVARAWNFGPAAQDALPVRLLLERVGELWPGGIEWRVDEREHPRENPALRLDSTRARTELGWQPLLGLEDGLRLTVEWFRAYRDGEDVRAVTLGQLPL
jgi:CDP-glucose 4,6-dehydratase